MRFKFDLWSRVSCGGDGGSGTTGNSPDYSAQAGGGTSYSGWANAAGADWGSGSGVGFGENWGAANTWYEGPVFDPATGTTNYYSKGQNLGPVGGAPAQGGITSIPNEQTTGTVKTVSAPAPQYTYATPQAQARANAIEQKMAPERSVGNTVVAPTTPQSPTLNPQNAKFSTDLYEPGYTSVFGGGILENAIMDGLESGNLTESYGTVGANVGTSSSPPSDPMAPESYGPATQFDPMSPESYVSGAISEPVSQGWSAPAYGDGLESANTGWNGSVTDYGNEGLSGQSYSSPSYGGGLESANIGWNGSVTDYGNEGLSGQSYESNGWASADPESPFPDSMTSSQPEGWSDTDPESPFPDYNAPQYTPDVTRDIPIGMGFENIGLPSYGMGNEDIGLPSGIGMGNEDIGIPSIGMGNEDIGLPSYGIGIENIGLPSGIGMGNEDIGLMSPEDPLNGNAYSQPRGMGNEDIGIAPRSPLADVEIPVFGDWGTNAYIGTRQTSPAVPAQAGGYNFPATFGPQTARTMAEYGLSLGYPKNAVAAMLGHAKVESLFDPSIRAKAKGENSIGLMQYNEKYGRQAAMLEAARKAGVKWDDPTFQARYAWDQLNDKRHTNPALLGILKDPNVTVAAATAAIQQYSQRAGVPHMDQRISSANSFASKLAGLERTTGTAGRPAEFALADDYSVMEPTRAMGITSVAPSYSPQIDPRTGAPREYSYTAPAGTLDRPADFDPNKAGVTQTLGGGFGGREAASWAGTGIGALGGSALAGPLGGVVGAKIGNWGAAKAYDVWNGQPAPTTAYTDYGLALNPFAPMNTPIGQIPNEQFAALSGIKDQTGQPIGQGMNPQITGLVGVDQLMSRNPDGTYSFPAEGIRDPKTGLGTLYGAPTAAEWEQISGVRQQLGDYSLNNGYNNNIGDSRGEYLVGANSGLSSNPSGSPSSTTAPPAPPPIPVAGQNVRNQPVFPDRDVPEPYRSMLIQSGYGLDGLGGWNYFPNSGDSRTVQRGGMATGGLVQGRGTETSDSVPAIIDGSTPAALSSGEFVFTGAAVRGMGGGDRMEGARRLHSMMKKAEGMARKSS
jgi:Phage tail lysozyme